MEAVLFDLDGTLLSSFKTIRRCLNSALDAVDAKPEGGVEVKPLVGRALEDIMEMYTDRVDEACEHYRTLQIETFRQDTVVFPGSIAILKKVKEEHGLKSGVVTLRDGRLAEIVMESIGFMPYLDVVIGKHDAPKAKPSPLQILAATDKLGIDPKNAIYIGDATMDMQAASAAGTLPVGVVWGSANEEQLWENGAKHVARTWEELNQIIDAALAGTHPQ